MGHTTDILGTFSRSLVDTVGLPYELSSISPHIINRHGTLIGID